MLEQKEAKCAAGGSSEVRNWELVEKIGAQSNVGFSFELDF